MNMIYFILKKHHNPKGLNTRDEITIALQHTAEVPYYVILTQVNLQIKYFSLFLLI